MHAVRRMVCDLPTGWLLYAALMALMIPALDGLWLMHPDGRMPLTAALFMAAPAGVQAATKLPIWRLLPVSRRQIGQARWWMAVGEQGQRGAGLLEQGPEDDVEDDE